jgi:hypothetical protein
LSPTAPPPAQNEFDQAVAAIAALMPADAAQSSSGTSTKASSMGTRLDDLITARDNRLDRNNQPGVPLVVALTVVLMAWIVVALLALYPGTQGWVKALHVTAAVTVVGLVQLPLLYLGSNESTRELLGHMISG